MNFKYFMLTLSILFTVSCATTKSTKQIPQRYQTGKDKNYPENKYITAYAFDTTSEQAELLARKKLISKLSSSISAKSFSLKKAYKKNSKLVSNSSQIKQIIKVKSNFKHNELIKIVDKYYDGKQHYVFAVLEKMQLAKLLESEMEVQNKNFKKQYDTALKFLKDLNFKGFKKILPGLIKAAFKYDNTLMMYSYVINDFSVFSKYNLSNSLSSLEKLYTEKLNQKWYILGIYKKITAKSFQSLLKNTQEVPVIIRNNDDFLKISAKNKYLTVAIYEILKEYGFNTEEFTGTLNNPLINQNTVKQITTTFENPDNKILVFADLIYKCSFDKAFYYCRTGAEIKAYNLETQKDIFYLSVEGQTSKKTKAVDINLNESLNKSIKKLKPVLKKELENYLIFYKDNE